VGCCCPQPVCGFGDQQQGSYGGPRVSTHRKE
jgi:hypothetical protein